MTQLTAEEMQGMSPEEIALLSEGLEEDGTPVEAGSATTPAPDDSDEDPEDDAPAAVKPSAVVTDDHRPKAADQSAAAPPETQAATAPVEEADEPTTAPAAFVPQYSAEVPADAAQQIAALKAEERAAFAKLMDGESDMDTDIYAAIRERTDAAIDALKVKVLTASIFQQANEQAQEQRDREEWEATKVQVFEKFKEDGLDYSDPKRPGLMAAYNHHLKALGSDPANERKTGEWFLKEADRLTREDLGIKPTAAAPAAPAKPARGVDRSAIPPTLSRVPPSADSAISGDEFSHLGSLDGAALEKAIAKMSPEELDRYLN